VRIEPANVVAFTIYDAPKLDPITVIMEDVGPGNGRLTVECYGEAWSGYWGAMGDRTLQEFIADCDAGYLANRMSNPYQKNLKNRDDYLLRIVTAVRDVLRTVRATDTTSEGAKP